MGRFFRGTVLLFFCLDLLLGLGGLFAQQIVWRDEFNGKTLDRDTWTYDVGGHGFGNGQLEFNTARSENSYVRDGNLVIEARREKYSGREFTSARLNTQGRFAYLYGTLQARIKVPDTANGIWPAFWLLGNNFPAIQWPRCGEIDILEIGGKEGITKGTQHRNINCALHFADKAQNKKSLVKWHQAKQDLHADFHIYKFVWTPQEVRFYVDEIEYGHWEIAGPEFREFHQPYFPILNVAVGSFKDSYTGIDTPGKITARFPARMQVDWIRLYGNPHTRVFLGKEAREKGKFGIYTEGGIEKLGFGDPASPDFDYQNAAALRTWNNMKASEESGTAAEGKRSWLFDVAAGDWFGGGVLVPNHRNMSNYSDGFLHFTVKSRSAAVMRVGIKSSRGSEFWLPLGDEKAEFGFARDNQWHPVKIPLNRFANIDFQTIHQMFMIAGDAPRQPVRLGIDHVWWEPGGQRPRPVGSSFGVFTDQPSHRTAGEFKAGSDGQFFIWEKTLIQAKSSPFEGTRSLALKSTGGSWCGAAFTPNVKHDLSEFSHAGSRLHFAMKTNSKKTFKVGMKSGNVESVGQKWITFKAGADRFGFARDGKWHVVEIPMDEFSKEVDLSQVSQLFEILATDGAIEEIELDDICFLADK